jgi:hypothetical protein
MRMHVAMAVCGCMVRTEKEMRVRERLVGVFVS